MFILVKYFDGSVYLSEEKMNKNKELCGKVIKPINDIAKEDFKRYIPDKAIDEEWDMFDIDEDNCDDSDYDYVTILAREKTIKTIENNLGIYLL